MSKTLILVSLALAGLTSQSFGSEPHRHLELFKVDSACSIPQQLLSEVAKGITPTMAHQMEQAAREFPVLLTDVTPGYDIQSLLSQWDGQFTLHHHSRTDICTVQFASLQAAQVRNLLCRMSQNVACMILTHPDPFNYYAHILLPRVCAVNLAGGFTTIGRWHAWQVPC